MVLSETQVMTSAFSDWKLIPSHWNPKGFTFLVPHVGGWKPAHAWRFAVQSVLEYMITYLATIPVTEHTVMAPVLVLCCFVHLHHLVFSRQLLRMNIPEKVTYLQAMHTRHSTQVATVTVKPRADLPSKGARLGF